MTTEQAAVEYHDQLTKAILEIERLNKHCHDLEAERDALIAENERLTAEAMFQQQMTEPEDIMFERIERAARASFRRHEASVRGQQMTRADSYESHLVWAAQAEVNAKLAAQRKVLKRALEALQLPSMKTESVSGQRDQTIAAIREVLK